MTTPLCDELLTVPLAVAALGLAHQSVSTAIYQRRLHLARRAARTGSRAEADVSLDDILAREADAQLTLLTDQGVFDRQTQAYDRYFVVYASAHSGERAEFFARVLPP